MEFLDENYKKLVEVLADARNAINWDAIDPKKGHEFFASRIKSAGRQPTFRRAVDFLGRKIGTRCISTDPDLITALDANGVREQTLERMREESMYLALMAAEFNKQRRDAKKTAEKAPEKTEVV